MSGTQRLVQLLEGEARLVCLVDEPWLQVLEGFATVHDLAQAALAAGQPLAQLARDQVGPRRISYDEVEQTVETGDGRWRFLPAVDHPVEPARCVLSGTGLTHRRGVETRQAMHAANATESVTDSMRMYELGVDGGRPAEGAVGTSPEWFHKGNGLALRAHLEPLEVPRYAEDGGEEPELAGVYLVDASGTPRRMGLAVANEFSDHQLERRNYLYLATSKLRTCALGPELVLDGDFSDVRGTVSVEREGGVLWSSDVHTGDARMCHSLANMEHHHFKHPLHRRPGDVHVHFFGADAFSFSAGVKLREGDVMKVAFAGWGRALRNPVAVDTGPEELVRVAPL